MAKRVFFSFHYQDVVDFRANVVRNHNVVKEDNGGFFDASIWESAKKQGDLALKRLINDALENTTVTVVLIGTHTYARRWVHYEIMKSLERGNKVIGVHINALADRNRQIKPNGPSPFDQLGLKIDEDGRQAKPTSWDGSKWIFYPDLAPFQILAQPLDKCGKHFQLSHWLPTYEWVADNGYNNFSDWIS
jgi:hypothetical protein